MGLCVGDHHGKLLAISGFALLQQLEQRYHLHNQELFAPAGSRGSYDKSSMCLGHGLCIQCNRSNFQSRVRVSTIILMRGPWLNTYHSGSLRNYHRCVCRFEHLRRDLSFGLLGQRCQLYRHAVSNAEQLSWRTSCTATCSLASHRSSQSDKSHDSVAKLSRNGFLS